jgi:death-on-curing protein
MTVLVWISTAFVKFVHSDQIAQYGGLAGIRDEGLLEASLARPRHLYAYGSATLFDLAAAYGFGIARNHPFTDGNKRTALMAMYAFLRTNGYSFDAPEPDAVIVMERLANGDEDQDSLAVWLQRYCRPV